VENSSKIQDGNLAHQELGRDLKGESSMYRDIYLSKYVKGLPSLSGINFYYNSIFLAVRCELEQGKRFLWLFFKYFLLFQLVKSQSAAD